MQHRRGRVQQVVTEHIWTRGSAPETVRLCRDCQEQEGL